MNLRVMIEVEVSNSIAETIIRNGLQLCRDGSSMQVCVPNTPTIPRRKTKVEFINNPITLFTEAVESCK